MSSKKTMEQRVEAKEKQLQEMLMRAKQYEAQLKALQAKQGEEERKKRTHRLIEIGAVCEAVLGSPIEKEMLPLLQDWLQMQEQKGNYFSRALGKDKSETTNVTEELPVPEL